MRRPERTGGEPYAGHASCLAPHGGAAARKSGEDMTAPEAGRADGVCNLPLVRAGNVATDDETVVVVELKDSAAAACVSLIQDERVRLFGSRRAQTQELTELEDFVCR